MDDIYNVEPKRGFFRSLFSGRMRRLSYFGWGVLLNIIASVFAVIITLMAEESTISDSAALVLGIISIVVVVCILFFYLSIIWRRLHDVNLPGPLGFIVIGIAMASEVPGLQMLGIVVLVISIMLLFAKGTKGPNKYGPDPLGEMGNSEVVERVFGGERGVERSETMEKPVNPEWNENKTLR